MHIGMRLRPLPPPSRCQLRNQVPHTAALLAGRWRGKEWFCWEQFLLVCAWTGAFELRSKMLPWKRRKELGISKAKVQAVRHQDTYENQKRRLTFTLCWANIYKLISLSAKGRLSPCVYVVFFSSQPRSTSDAPCLTLHESPLTSPRSPMRQRSYFRQLLIPSLHKKVLPYMEPKSDSLAFNLLALLGSLGPYVK